MFETFGTTALFLSKDAVLSCYAFGRTSGISIDMGRPRHAYIVITAPSSEPALVLQVNRELRYVLWWMGFAS